MQINRADMQMKCRKAPSCEFYCERIDNKKSLGKTRFHLLNKEDDNHYLKACF